MRPEDYKLGVDESPAKATVQPVLYTPEFDARMIKSEFEPISAKSRNGSGDNVGVDLTTNSRNGSGDNVGVDLTTKSRESEELSITPVV